jgi:hypothetical protein
MSVITWPLAIQGLTLDLMKDQFNCLTNYLHPHYTDVFVGLVTESLQAISVNRR